MAIFLVTPLANNFETIRTALDEKQIDHYTLKSDAGFLVAASGTSEELSNRIGITSAEGNSLSLGTALVTRVSSYYGIGPTLMWEWLKSRMEQG